MSENDLKAVILADTHMLGPYRGHPFDKLRREWQMKRSFQATMDIFQPDVVFILGDVFDEGNWVEDRGFEEYVDRFKTIFHTPTGTRMYAIHGNHDVHFHYQMHPHLVNRFNAAFNTTGVNLIREKITTSDGSEAVVNFVTINSMAMDGDGCNFCIQAREQLNAVSRKLTNSSSPPFVLQHFPTYRTSDEKCLDKNSENNAKYREKWETLSKEASRMITRLLNPRAYFSGHTHHYCIHENDKGVKEYTVASYNWRNIDNPSFLLATFTPHDYSISKCDMPKESTVFMCYGIGAFLSLIIALICSKKRPLDDNKRKDM